MIKPEHVRQAKRITVIVAAAMAVGGAAYAGARALVRSEEVERRVSRLEDQGERLERQSARIEGKLDALLQFFRIGDR